MHWICRLLLLGVCCEPLIAEETTAIVPTVRVDNVFSEESPWLKVVESEGYASVIMKEPGRQPIEKAILIASPLEETATEDIPPWGGVLIVSSSRHASSSRPVLPPGEPMMIYIPIRR